MGLLYSIAIAGTRSYLPEPRDYVRGVDVVDTVDSVDAVDHSFQHLNYLAHFRTCEQLSLAKAT